MAQKSKAIAFPVVATENGEYIAAFKSLNEFQNTLYGAAALFIFRELYSWWKEKQNKTGERLDRMEKVLHRLEIITELREKERK